MGRLRKADADAIAALEQAVINDTPDAAAKLCQNCGTGVLTAHILGIAGRFCGLDMVKALVENGASFQLGLRELDAVKTLFPRIFENEYATYLPDFFILFLLKDIDRTREYALSEYFDKLADREGNPLKPVCEEELVRVVEYLCDNAEKVCFSPGDYLYFAILTDDRNMITALKRRGITISGEKVRMLTQGGGGNEWFAYCRLVEVIKDEDFVRIMSTLIAEINATQAAGDKKLYFTEWFCHVNGERFFSPEFMVFFLEHFNQSKMNKTKLMREMIFYENIACLEIVARYGWLKAPRKRDEMIQYATEQQKKECIAFLLEYKNRTADLAAEAEKAEKKMMRELAADPNSLSQLRKNWSFRKKSDGTLTITGYKGKSTVLVIPERIGEDKVTEIDNWSLSTAAPRIKEPTRKFRETITKITLPKSIKIIGESAFRGLVSLQEIEIQTGVEKIGECAFSDCNQLRSVVIPEGVTVMEAGVFNCYEGKSELESVVLPSTLDIFSETKGVRYMPILFGNCPNVTVRIPPLSKARKYCEEHHLKYEYYDMEDMK